MSYDILEIYKRCEFNKTELGTLSGLIQSVIKKGDKMRVSYENLIKELRCEFDEI